ncbi:stalk domain-containing protein [Herbivorax sp. ANBcel31]|uniref:stalk domain-containing protein n=1 Tax=Herbivorax sp. ANBcel31 TaxID=3069754 RepID=UPI0027B3298D|nr:stalk domain-containing protein [Herbivorax sp. ANBcel31]MDQ2087042.1 stalk domain-containing protein [Herbivorax sp. ANBcel31]
MKLLSFGVGKNVVVSTVLISLFLSMFSVFFTTSARAQDEAHIKITLYGEGQPIESVEVLDFVFLGLKKVTGDEEKNLNSSPDVKWTSSNTDVATVRDRILSPLSGGKTVITAEYEGYTDSIEIEVLEKEKLETNLKISISDTTVEYVEGLENYRALSLMKVTTYGEKSKEDSIADIHSIEWTSSNTEVATMRGSIIVPVSEGKTVITAEYEGYTDSVEVEIVKAELTELTFFNVEEMEEIDLTLFFNKISPYGLGSKVKSERGYEYSLYTEILTDIEEPVWEVDDPDIVDIQDGIHVKNIFAKAPGSTTITLKYKGLEESINVNVTNPKVKDISLSRERVAVPVPRAFSLDLYATLEDGSTKNISRIAEWSSSDMSIATVVTGLPYAGETSIRENEKAVITAEYEDFVGTVDVFGVTGTTIEITVDAPVMAIEEYLADSKDEKEIDPGRGTKPIIRNDRMLLPIRTVVEEFGGEITWDDSTREVSITMFDKNIVLTIDKYVAVVNGTVEEMDVEPIIHNDRTMLPLRFISENLGLKVDWEHETRTASITDYDWEDQI